MPERFCPCPLQSLDGPLGLGLIHLVFFVWGKAELEHFVHLESTDGTNESKDGSKDGRDGQLSWWQVSHMHPGPKVQALVWKHVVTELVVGEPYASRPQSASTGWESMW